MPEPQPPQVTQEQAIDELLRRSGRDHVPIRKTFLQQGADRIRTPGPAASLCRRHDERALDLYLLIHAVTSGDGHDVTLSAAAWARLLGLSGSASARSGVSKALRRLVDLGLIRKDRAGNLARLTLLDEDGNGAPYQHPGRDNDRYLKLPHDYWTGDWHLTLTMPGKVTLLIALSLVDGFYLPTEKGPDWYGISADTAQRGLAELEQHGLLEVDTITKIAPLSATGVTTERRFTLQAPFGPLGTAPQPEEAELATVTRLHA